MKEEKEGWIEGRMEGEGREEERNEGRNEKRNKFLMKWENILQVIWLLPMQKHLPFQQYH